MPWPMRLGPLPKTMIFFLSDLWLSLYCIGAGTAVFIVLENCAKVRGEALRWCEVFEFMPFWASAIAQTAIGVFSHLGTVQGERYPKQEFLY